MNNYYPAGKATRAVSGGSSTEYSWLSTGDAQLLSISPIDYTKWKDNFSESQQTDLGFKEMEKLMVELHELSKTVFQMERRINELEAEIRNNSK